MSYNAQKITKRDIKSYEATIMRHGYFYLDPEYDIKQRTYVYTFDEGGAGSWWLLLDLWLWDTAKLQFAESTFYREKMFHIVKLVASWRRYCLRYPQGHGLQRFAGVNAIFRFWHGNTCSFSLNFILKIYLTCSVRNCDILFIFGIRHLKCYSMALMFHGYSHMLSHNNQIQIRVGFHNPSIIYISVVEIKLLVFNQVFIIVDDI